MKSPRLTKTTAGYYDLLMENGKFLWVEDGTQAAQLSMERISTVKSEYSLNDFLSTGQDEGTRLYEVILRADKSRAEKEFEIKRIILGTTGIEAISELDWSVANHELTISLKGKTAWGDIEIGEEIIQL